MALANTPPRHSDVARLSLFALAIIILVGATITAVALASEDATSVEASSAALAEAAMAPIELPGGADLPSSSDAGDDVNFGEVVASMKRQSDSEARSTLADHSTNDVCSDASLTNLCRYASGGPIPTVTPRPTATAKPTPSPTAKPRPKPASATTNTRPAATRIPSVAPTETPAVEPAPPVEPETPAEDPNATLPPETPVTDPATTDPAGTIGTPEPVDEDPAEPEPSAPDDEVVYVYTEPPSPDNPSPPVIACSANADGSLNCPEAPE